MSNTIGYFDYKLEGIGPVAPGEPNIQAPEI